MSAVGIYLSVALNWNIRIVDMTKIVVNQEVTAPV